MHPDIRLIALDIDGCLIGPDEQLLLPTATALRQASSIAPIALLTGRSRSYVERLIEALTTVNAPSVIEGGCFLFIPENGITIPHPSLPEDLSIFNNIRRMLETSLPDIRIEAGKDICISLHRPKETSIEPLFKKVLSILEDIPETVSVTHSSEAVDIIPYGIDKGAGIEFLSAYSRISLNHILVIGDSKNDLPSLKRAGMVGCPANAHDDVKTIVKEKNGHIAERSYGEGIVDILRHFGM